MSALPSNGIYPRRHGVALPTAAALTALGATAFMLTCVALTMAVVHPNAASLGKLIQFVDQQNQNAKTLLYLAAFAAVLPGAVWLVPRAADRQSTGPNGEVLAALAAVLLAGLAVDLLVVRLSANAPWGDGVRTLLVGCAVWWVCAALLWRRAARRPISTLHRLGTEPLLISLVLGTSLLTLVLCVSNLRAIALGHLGEGAVAVGAVGTVLWLSGRLGRRRRVGAALDAGLLVLIVLAVLDIVIYRPAGVIPATFFEPGVVQFQQDWILGPTNQLLGGGALLVNVPSSQYGVGLVYFLDAWFHIVPIGYGTFGLVDGLLTALWYASGYSVLRLAGVRRPLAVGALLLAVSSFAYNLVYPVGQLPEQGPLRFGLPMLLMVLVLAARRWPSRSRLLRLLALLVLGLSAVWALEGFAYTLFTYLVISVVEALLELEGGRLRRLLRSAVTGALVCLAAHALLAVLTLLGTGQLPHWNQYLYFLRSLLLGGKEGSITYGFDHWSPGLMMGAVVLASAAAASVALLRAPDWCRGQGTRLVAIAGMTAYAIASFSYTDNRSSTYLLLYTALPVLLIVTLWADLAARLPIERRVRLTAATVLGAVCALLLAAAWPAIGTHFSRSALAHAYPGSGLRAALSRLKSSPSIDPRTPEGVALLHRYVPGDHVLVVMPTGQDLQIEILMHARRYNRLFVGDPNMDGFVPQVWRPIIGRQIAALHDGDRLLIDRDGLRIGNYLHAHPGIDPVNDPISDGAAQEEWILQRMLARFRIRVVHSGRWGLVVGQLVLRRSPV